MVNAAKRSANEGDPPKSILAAQYVRMSTEHQRYSTENQSESIRRYAEQRGITIVRTYADHGKSGLRVDGRDALKQLIDDVQAGTADFNVILVYDVSRWGRFQDADESAYYEFICKEAGIAVHYCAEQFENDGSLSATIIKGMKRAMAGEYSRELSTKVFAGQCRLITLGFRQGGNAGYGLRRQLIDEHRQPKGELLRRNAEEPADRSRRPCPRAASGSRDRATDVSPLRRRADGAGHRAGLNAEGYRTDLDRPWTRGTVHQVLTNEKYLGAQRLQPHLLQAEEATCPKSAGHVGTGRRCVCSHRSAVALRGRPANHPRSRPAIQRRRDAHSPVWALWSKRAGSRVL